MKFTVKQDWDGKIAKETFYLSSDGELFTFSYSPVAGHFDNDTQQLRKINNHTVIFADDEPDEVKTPIKLGRIRWTGDNEQEFIDAGLVVGRDYRITDDNELEVQFSHYDRETEKVVFEGRWNKQPNFWFNPDRPSNQ